MSEVIEDTGSLSEHEAQHYPNPARAAESTAAVAAEVLNDQGAGSEDSGSDVPGTEAKGEVSKDRESRERDETGKFTKHRAKSQQASAEDVPRIKNLTREREEAREEARSLRARLDEYERGKKDGNAGRMAAPSHSVEQRGSSEFTEKEPTIEQFEKEADPYAAWIRAVNRYDRKKEAFEAEQQRIAGERQKVEQDGQAYLIQKSNEYAEKVNQFVESHPDFNDLVAKFNDWDLPPLAGATILEHENGPQLVYNLLKKPDELAGLILLTDGKPVTEKTVALATRWLENRALDAQTGSPAPVVHRKPTPTPPNPVRTVPSGGSDSDDDVESMSLSSFEKKFARGRR